MASEIFKNNIDKTSSGYKVIFSYSQYNDVTNELEMKYAEVDVQDGGLDVKSNVELTSFPTLQGHHISDHIYRLPIEIGIKGEFADNGLKAYGWVGEDRLAKVQAEFEACQRLGIKFKIVTIRNDDATDKSNCRFLARSNMVLQSISWTQHQHSLSFNFNFKEALSSNISRSIATKTQDDPNLPAITDLSAASLVGELISTDSVIAMTIQVLQELELVNDATFKHCLNTIAITGIVGSAIDVGIFISIIAATHAASAAIATAAAAGTAAAAAATAAGATSVTVVSSAGAASMLPVVGWVAAAAIAVVAGVIAIFNIVEINKRHEIINRYKQLGRDFNVRNGMTESEKDKVAIRFIEFLAEVKQTIDNELSDIAVYRIAKADRQECTLNVNGTFYVMQIEKNDDDLSYRIKCYHLGITEVASLPKIIGHESFADCTDSATSYFFYDKWNPQSNSTYRVYIINRASYMQSLQNKETTEDKLNEYMMTDKEKYEAEKEALLDYAFVVSPYALTNLTDRVTAAIKKALG